MIRIAVDGMGGDFAPKEIVNGTLIALDKFKDIEIIIFGDENLMAPYLRQHDRLSVVHTPHYLSMGEKDPIKQYRTNKEMSMFMAMQAVKDGKADAVVSSGPTQALVVAGHFILRRMKNMQRVAIAPIIPSVDGKGRILLDSGANTDTKPEHLLDFAIYASIVANRILKREHPQVALLNIGTEEGKGRELDKAAFKLLQNSSKINFYGNMETKDILTSDADVFLSDGFTANMVMKTIEGAAKGLGAILKREIKASLGGKIGAIFMHSALKRFKKGMDASEIGGALLMGLNGIVIKAHGSSDANGFYNGIRQAKEMVEADVINIVSETLNKKEDPS